MSGATIMGPARTGVMKALWTTVFGAPQLERGSWSQRIRDKGSEINYPLCPKSLAIFLPPIFTSLLVKNQVIKRT